jgi:hypothetical protein
MLRMKLFGSTRPHSTIRNEYGHAVGFIRKLAEEKVLVVRSISRAK